jgi:hypothetical protein
MEWLTLSLGLTKHVFGFLETRESRKYIDRVLYLEKEYLRETSKDENKIDTNYLDSITIELRQLGEIALASKR